MLALEQNVDVKVRVGGIHSVANQEGPILAIQDLDPNPSKLLHRRVNLHFEGLLTGRFCKTAGDGWSMED